MVMPKKGRARVCSGRGICKQVVKSTGGLFGRKVCWKMAPEDFCAVPFDA